MNPSKSLYQETVKSVWFFCTVLLALAFGITLTLISFDDAISQSERSRQINKLVRTAQFELLEAESAHLSFLYAAQGDLSEQDLNKYQEEILGSLTAAAQMTKEPDQQARIEAMKDAAKEKMEALNLSLSAYRRGEKPEALNLVRSEDDQLDEFKDKATVVMTEESQYVEDSKKHVDRFSFWLKAFVWFVVVAGWLVSYRWLTAVRTRLAPLELCVKRAEQIAENQFDGPDLPLVFADDEVGKLTQSFNKMAGSLRREAQKVESARKRVQETALSLSDRAIEQSAALTQLSSGIQEISATVQELNLSASQMSEKVGGLVDDAKGREKAGAKGLLAVEEADNATERVRDQVESVAQFTVALNEKAARVERIVFFVNELTERSNILSINAALLASTSGGESEAFSVLAEEMQKLTSRSKESTLEIHETLQSIRTEIQRVVLATEETKKQVESGDKAAKQASRSIKVLKEAVDEGNDTFLQIVAAVRQQNQALGQVEQALVAMRESSQLVEEGSLSLKDDAGVLAALNLELQNSELLKAVRNK